LDWPFLATLDEAQQQAGRRRFRDLQNAIVKTGWLA